MHHPYLYYYYYYYCYCCSIPHPLLNYRPCRSLSLSLSTSLIITVRYVPPATCTGCEICKVWVGRLTNQLTVGVLGGWGCRVLFS